MPRPDPSAPVSTVSAGSLVLIACGGTGGHLFPGVAVAEALRVRHADAVLIISEKDIDRRAAARHHDLEFIPLPAKPLAKPWSPAFPGFLASALRARAACRRLIRDRRVGAVLGMGGFTSMVPAWVGRRLGLPVFLHESNAVPGRANRLAARFADRIFLTIEAAGARFAGRSCEVVGTPVRPELQRLPGRGEARQRLGLDPDKPVLLVLGGSQGARALNDAAIEALALLPDDACQALLLTGPADEARVREAVQARLPARQVVVAGFCEDMPAAYAASTVAMSRAGASSLAELAICGLPAILVPYPHAADDHQTANATAYAGRGGAVLVPQDELKAEAVADRLRSWIAQPETLSPMRRAMQDLALPGAAEAMAARILATLSP